MLLWIGSGILILIIIIAIVWSRISGGSKHSYSQSTRSRNNTRPGSNRSENSISDTLKNKLKGC